MRNITNHIETEFNRVINMRKDKDSKNNGENVSTVAALTLDEILQFKSLSDMPIDFRMLGVLWVIDRNQNGCFNIEDLIEFAHWCTVATSETNPVQFQAEVQAQCTLTLWGNTKTDEGKTKFKSWFARLISENNPEIKYLPHLPSMKFLNMAAIKTIHEILNILDSFGVDFQSFFDLMQRVSEEMGLLQLDDDSLDDWVPVVVVELFADHFIHGFANMMQQLTHNTHPNSPSGALKDPFGNLSQPHSMENLHTIKNGTLSAENSQNNINSISESTTVNNSSRDTNGSAKGSPVTVELDNASNSSNYKITITPTTLNLNLNLNKINIPDRWTKTDKFSSSTNQSSVSMGKLDNLKAEGSKNDAPSPCHSQSAPQLPSFVIPVLGLPKAESGSSK